MVQDHHPSDQERPKRKGRNSFTPNNSRQSSSSNNNQWYILLQATTAPLIGYLDIPNTHFVFTKASHFALDSPTLGCARGSNDSPLQVYIAQIDGYVHRTRELRFVLLARESNRLYTKCFIQKQYIFLSQNLKLVSFTYKKVQIIGISPTPPIVV